MLVLLHGRELKVGDTLESNDQARVKVTVTELTEEHLRLRVINCAVKLSLPWSAVEKNFAWPEVPTKRMLHGRELKAHDVVVYEGDIFNVEGFAHDGTVKIEGGGLEVYIPQDNVGKCLSWPKGVPDTQAELRHYYNTVITDMCKGTTVKPWECVRASFPDGSKANYKVAPDFKGYEPTFYEFALTVHLNRPVWVGSVLYVGENRADCGTTAWTVQGITDEAHLKVVPQGQQRGEVVVTKWRDWLVWDKPVKQKAPTRVKVGYCNKHYVSVPEMRVAGLSVVCNFGTHKEVVEFYEIFKNVEVLQTLRKGIP